MMTTWHSLLADPDDLPPDDTDVLAWWAWPNSTGAMTVAYRRVPGEWHTVPPYAVDEVPALTPDAWMPLPAPPVLDQEAA